MAVAAYEACVPRDFWSVRAKDITGNREVFDGVVRKYARRLDTALKKGYGLVFLGDNGVGKTYLISYVLMKAIRAGRSAYYTTMPQLDHDIKRGFSKSKIEEHLAWLLTSDFLAIDELGKEHYKPGQTTFMDTQIERILKQRCDDSLPVLLATNLDHEALIKSYGPTVGSIIAGKFQAVAMEPGDYRVKMAKRMTGDMGYGE
jgi:DNA replication protein DnaC